jgi:DNA-binding transcriptional LysR family regulator
MDDPESAWDRLIGERVRLRELRILSVVSRCGSMAKAAAALSMTQPAVSQAVSTLEAALGVRLLDRGPRGVALTAYGAAMLRRSTEAFDALALGVREIGLLADPGAGEVVVGASESYVAGGVLAGIIRALGQRYPRLRVRVAEANTAAMDFTELRERRVDVMLGRVATASLPDDLHADVLFEEALHVVAGGHNAWARARRIGLAQLADKPWILAPPDTAVFDLVAAAYRAAGLAMPDVRVTTYSMNLRLQLLAEGDHVTVFPASLIRHNAARWKLRVLPVALGRKLPVAAITLRNRTQSAAVLAFIKEAKAATATS